MIIRFSTLALGLIAILSLIVTVTEFECLVRAYPITVLSASLTAIMYETYNMLKKDKK